MKTLSQMQSGLHRHQNRELFEKTLNVDEIEALIDKARESALAIKKDKERNKEERKQAKEVLDFIDDVEPNKKYYYTFRTMNFAKQMSNPSPIYELSLIHI